MRAQKLIRKCRNGDRSAQKQMVDRYSGLLYSICCRYVNDKDFAKDCLQESWIQIFWNLDKYKEEGKWESWISAVTLNKCKEMMRKNNKWLFDEIEAETADLSVNKERTMIQEESVSEFMRQLSGRQRIVVNMYLVEDYSHKEIADFLEISESSSRSLLTRAMKILRNHFEVTENENDKKIFDKRFMKNAIV